MTPQPAAAAYAALFAAALLALPHTARAGTETIIYDFKNQGTGFAPSGPLMKVGNLFYGVTQSGGADKFGTLYSVTPGGTHKILHAFQGGTDGETPTGSLLNVGGTIYGTTFYGGADHQCGSRGCGTVYSLAPNGTYTVLHVFSEKADGFYPGAGLVSLGGVLYGTTTMGGACSCGAVFSITPSGTEKLVHVFQSSDGFRPYGLTVAGSMLYGVTEYGGAHGRGTVFSLDPSSGSEAVLTTFDKKGKGELPMGTLLYDGRALYGTTIEGGNSCGHGTCGTVYKLSLQGKLTTLHAFTGSDGQAPWAGLASSHGVFYGTTSLGGSANDGTVYAITRQGALSVVYAFGAAAGDAVEPVTALTVSGTSLFGTTAIGGASTNCPSELTTCGTVYRVVP